MPVAEKDARALLGHLKDLNGYPADAWMKSKIVRAAIAHAESKDHLEAALERHIELVGRWFPSIPELIQACKASGSQPKWERTIDNCEACGGNGLVVKRFLVTTLRGHRTRWEPLTPGQEIQLWQDGFQNDIDKQVITDGAVRCRCCGGGR